MLHLKIKPSNDADVLVVGAGPAGASAAAHLAGTGLRVTVIDQHAFPRDKVCGDFVGPVALVELQRLGVIQNPVYQQTNVIHSAAVHLDGKRLITSLIPEVSGLPAHGRVVPRKQLDAWIVDAAQTGGAQIIEGWRVRSYAVDSDGVTVYAGQRGQQRTWRGRVLIGADGSNSLVARQMHGKRPSYQDRIIAVRAYYEGVRGPSDQADLFFSSTSFPGYYWLFPTGKTGANVGVGMLQETFPVADKHLPRLLTDLVKRDPALADRLMDARQTGKIAGWPLAIYNPSTPVIADRILLTGDAAGLINPLNGEGIQYALLSGRWAAETVLAAATRNDFTRSSLAAYADSLHRNLRYDMALAGLIVQLIRNRNLNPLWMQALRIILARACADPRYADVTGSVLAGMEPASSVIQPRVLGGTVQQAVMSLGIGAIKHALHGPRHILQEGMQAAGSGVLIAAETARHPVDYGRWSAGVMLGAAELASQVVKHFTAGHVAAAGPAAHASLIQPEEKHPAIVLRIAGS